MVGWHQRLDGREFQQAPGVGDAIQPSHPVVPFSFCLQSFPASGSIHMSQFFTSGGQSIGVSASASVLPMNIQDRFPLGLTGFISLQSKGLSSQLKPKVRQQTLQTLEHMLYRIYLENRKPKTYKLQDTYTTMVAEE